MKESKAGSDKRLKYILFYEVLYLALRILRIDRIIKIRFPIPVKLTGDDKKIISYVLKNKLTMVSYRKLAATAAACKYVIKQNIKGDFVECGVWRGGNAIVAAAIFKSYGENRKVWLFDTFEGFTNIKTTEKDIYARSRKAMTDEMMSTGDNIFYDPLKCGNSISDVKASFEKCGLLNDDVIFIKGSVMDTLEDDLVPDKIAVLRMDTDLYESTLKQLTVLYPKVECGGVMLEDDYGTYDGPRLAMNEYFSNIRKPQIQYIDAHGIMVIKGAPV